MIYGNNQLQKGQTTDGHIDANGDFIAGAIRYGAPIMCDDEPAGAASERVFDDGVARRYSYTLTLDPSAPDFEIGERVRYTRNGSKPKEYDVKGFHRYAFVCKLWL